MTLNQRSMSESRQAEPERLAHHAQLEMFCAVKWGRMSAARASARAMNVCPGCTSSVANALCQHKCV